MRDFFEYLRAYRAYVSANLGWGKAVSVSPIHWLSTWTPPHDGVFSTFSGPKR